MMISPYLKRRIILIQLIMKLHVYIRILFLVRSNLLCWNRIFWCPIAKCCYNSWNGAGLRCSCCGRCNSFFIYLLVTVVVYCFSIANHRLFQQRDLCSDCFSNVVSSSSDGYVGLRCGCCGQCNDSFLLLCELLFHHRKPWTVSAMGFVCFWLFQQWAFKQQQ